MRLEPMLVGLFLACWLLAFLSAVGVISLAGSLSLSLYGLYSTAAALGWLAGNVYVHRVRRLNPPRTLRRRVLLVYWLGPPGVVHLLRAMAPAFQQAAAPLVPLYSLAVSSVFFLVPVVLRPRGPGAPPRRPDG